MAKDIIAKLNKLRLSSRKARLVADLIRGKDALRAKAILTFSGKAAARPFLKLLDSALANARHNFHLTDANLYLAQVLVDEGAKLKRWRPRSRGRAFHIQKKTSHLIIVLKEKGGRGIKAAAVPAEEKTSGVGQTKAVKVSSPATKSRLRGGEPAQKKASASQGAKRIFRRKAF